MQKSDPDFWREIRENEAEAAAVLKTTGEVA
jgi:hypothetical protein